MARRFAWVGAALLVLALCVRQVLAEGGLVIVTKENQAKLGLNFTLVAERASDTAVLVRMEIPRQGKLKTLRAVTMTINPRNPPPGVPYSPLVSAPLKTAPGKTADSWVVTFQVSPELADQCSIDLNVPSDDRFSYEVYGVELKGYVIERK